MTKFQKTNLRELVRVLRSGEYAQTQGSLCDLGKEYDCFCVTGVMCDLYQLATGKLVVRERHGYMMYNGGESFSPDEVDDYFGLLGKTSELMGMNDLGWSFKRLANYIEKKFVHTVA